MPLSCTVNSQNLKRSRDSQHIPFGVVQYIIHAQVGLSYASVTISTRNLKCIASPIPKAH